MTSIKTTKHFDLILEKQASMACFLFMSNKHQQDKSLSEILMRECKEVDIKLYYIEINNTELFNLVDRYGTGLLPKYIFIKDSVLLHAAYGLTSNKEVKQEIKIAGDKV